MSFEKTHDSIMNNLESLISFMYDVEFMDMVDTKEYMSASASIYSLVKALDSKSLTPMEE